MTRALIGEEGGVPPILLWSHGGPWGWGVYLRTRRWRVTAGPMYGWRWTAAQEGEARSAGGGPAVRAADRDEPQR